MIQSNPILPPSLLPVPGYLSTFYLPTYPRTFPSTLPSYLLVSDFYQSFILFITCLLSGLLGIALDLLFLASFPIIERAHCRHLDNYIHSFQETYFTLFYFYIYRLSFVARYTLRESCVHTISFSSLRTLLDFGQKSWKLSSHRNLFSHLVHCEISTSITQNIQYSLPTTITF